MEPTIGRIVIYKLSADDAENINRRRTTGLSVATRMSRNEATGTHWPQGAQAHIGNPASAGDELPLVICRIWPNEYGSEPGINGQVFLDGNDTLWVTSVREGNENGQWHWPTRTIETTAELANEPVNENAGPAEISGTGLMQQVKTADSGGHKKRRG